MTQSRTLEADPAVESPAAPAKTVSQAQRQRAVHTRIAAEPWYKTAVIYELHVRAFQDTDSDGVGDFKGLTKRLDYLQDIGITAIWLLPFYPSPLRDDGYDIADYTGVNESYGSMRDVRRFVREAHKRGLRVITELVLNHTSDQHRWFQRARQSPPGSVYRDFYVWSDTPDKYDGVRIIFQDYETSNWTWDPVAKAYYWHRFYSHQPDLNFENPKVREELVKVMDFWFDAGVDGMRLDAVPYLFEREGTSCENLPETHEYLKSLRAHVESKYPDRMFLAEANQWPEDAVHYFGDGDECHMSFHFPLMPRLFMSLRMENRYPIIDILDQTPEIPKDCQWALFLRNHDELTLEMVTDEERDYMYRVYANDPNARINLGIRRRLAPLLGNDRRKIELLNALLFSLPGTPVIYYGDEIGMGDNIYLGDRDSVRTPMQWSPDRNAGFSRTNPQKLFLPTIIDPEYHFEAVNVEAQQNNPSSLLWWMKRLIALRKRYTVFGTGDIRFLHPENPKVVAFVRSNHEDTILIIANLSRFSQAVELDLSEYRGLTPVELFGHTEFPQIGELPYFITVGPHGFYWFSLTRGGLSAQPEDVEQEEPAQRIAEISISGDPYQWFHSTNASTRLNRVLGGYVPKRRWFRSKARTIRNTQIADRISIPVQQDSAHVSADVFLVDFDYVEGEPERYAVPIAIASQGHTAYLFASDDPAVIAHVHSDATEEPFVLYDATADPQFGEAALDLAMRRRRVRGQYGRLIGTSTRIGRSTVQDAEPLDVHPGRAEQSNSSIIFGELLIMKLFRATAPGINPELEILRHLTQHVGFKHTPQLAGSLEYDSSDEQPATIAVLQTLEHNEGDGWRYTLDELGRFYERVVALRASEGADAPTVPHVSMLELSQREVPGQVHELYERYLQSAELLGRRTAELHLALATPNGNDAFAPETYTLMKQRSLLQSLRNSSQQSLNLLRKQYDRLPEHTRDEASALLEREDEVMERLRAVNRGRLGGMRIRIHGDFHLGQVLWTGRDFVIIDFEGEPARALSERRLKWTPLRDVAGMLRSFQYAAYTGLYEQVHRGNIADETEAVRAFYPWARFWQSWTSAVYLRAYLNTVHTGKPDLLPEQPENVRALLDAWLLEKAMYEVAYELNNRPQWVRIPIHGALEILDLHAEQQTRATETDTV